MLYFLLLAVPFPLASNRPVFQWFWVIYIAILSLWHFSLTRPSERKNSGFVATFLLISIAIVVWTWTDMVLGTTATPPVSLPKPEVGTSLEFVTGHRGISVLFLLSHAIWFAVIFDISRSIRDAKYIVRFIGITCALYASYGLVAYFAGNSTVLWYEKWAYHESLTSTFVNRNSFAAFCGLGLQALLAYAFCSRETNEAGFRSHMIAFLQVMAGSGAILILAIFVTATALILSGSRAGMLSSFIATTIYFVAYLVHSGTQTRSMIRSITGSALFLLVVGLMLEISGDSILGRFQQLDNADQRFFAYPLILDAIKHQPLSGYGFGSFIDVFRVFRTPEMYSFFDRAHSDILELVMTVGLPAAILIFWLVCHILYRLFRALKSSNKSRPLILLGITTSIQIGLHSLVDFSLQMPAVSYTYLAILATSLSVSDRTN